MVNSVFESGNSGVVACFTGRKAGDGTRGATDSSLSGLFSSFRPYLPVQRHTDRVLTVTGGTPDGLVGDAVVTAERGLLLGVRVADCVPILLFDPETASVGAVHAGWRGTAMSIVVKTIERMTTEFGSRPEDIRVSVGPSIRGCCYNVGPEVVDGLVRTVHGEGWKKERGTSVHVDLALVNRLQVLEAGVRKNHVTVVPECTFCLNQTYFSYRREGPGAGRQAGFIGLHPLADRPQGG